MLHCFERQRAERRRPGLDNRRMRVTAVRLRRDKMTFDACIAVAFAGLLLSACHRHAPTGQTEYAYRPWGFEVAFASAPKETDSPADGANPHSFTVEYQDQTRDFSVWASDLLGRQVDLDTMADPAAGFLAQQAGATPGPKSDTTSSDGVPGREYPPHLGEFSGARIRIEPLDRPQDIEQFGRGVDRALEGRLSRTRDAQLYGRIFQRRPRVGFELPETVVSLGIRNWEHGDTSVDQRRHRQCGTQATAADQGFPLSDHRPVPRR